MVRDLKRSRRTDDDHEEQRGDGRGKKRRRGGTENMETIKSKKRPGHTREVKKRQNTSEGLKENEGINRARRLDEILRHHRRARGEKRR